MVNSKIVAGFVLVLVVAFGGGITYVLENVSFDNIFSGAVENPTGFVTKYISPQESRDLRIYATLVFVQEPGLQIDTSEPMNALSIKYYDSDAKISLGSLSINTPAEANMELRSFKGGISITREGLSFSGTSGQVKYDSGYISQDNPIKVSGNDISYKLVGLSGVPKTSFSLQNVSGTITVTENNNMIVYTASDTTIRLDSFRGGITVASDNMLILDGTGVFRTDMLLAPGN